MATPKDTKAIQELWAYCFDDNEKFLDWYFTNRYNSSNALVAVDEKISSALQVIPYNISLRGSKQRAGYIIGVSSFPEARGNSSVSKLIKRSILDMKERNYSISILMPFMFDFYANYGWGLCYHHLVHDIDIQSLSSIAKRGGKSVRVDDEQALNILKTIYDTYTSAKNGYVMRESREWKDIWEDIKTDQGFIYYFKDGMGQPSGYIIYYLKDDYIHVKEMVSLDWESQRVIYNFIFNHRSHLKRVKLMLSSDDLTHLTIPDLNQNVKLQPFMMARIIDIEELLKSIRYPEGVDCSLTFQIKDEIALWNNNPFCLEVYNGKGNYKNLNQSNVDIACSINTFSQIVFGEVEIEDLLSLGQISYNSIDSISTVKKIFPKQRNYINEYL